MNPPRTNIPRIDGGSRLPQCSAIRTTAKPSKIAKPAGVGPKSSSLPKSLSSEKICQASNLVQKTTNFQNRFGKPPESKSGALMNTKKEANAPAVQNSTVVISRPPAVKRSATYVRGPDEAESIKPMSNVTQTYVRGPDEAESIKPMSNVTQTIDSGNNLTQNVISKLKQKTFTTSNPDRMSISPIHPMIPNSLNNRKASEATKNVFSNANSPCGSSIRLMTVNSTPLVRNIAIDKISTKYLNEHKVHKVLPPLSFDITGTDLDSTGALQVDPKNEVNSAIASIPTPPINFTNAEMVDNAAISNLPARDKFNLLTQDMSKDDLIVDTTLNLYAANITMETSTLIDVTQRQPSNLINFSSTINSADSSQSTTMIPCLGESKCENTLVPSMAADDEKMEVDDRDNLPSCAESNPPSSAPIDMPNKQRFSFGQDMTEWTLDCSIELCDSSVASSAANLGSPSHLKKQNSFEEKSLSILTPDQMKEFSNNTNLNLDLPLFPGKMSMHQCRVDQTPSPEELPLDPVGVKTDISDMLTGNDNQITSGQYEHEQQLSQTDSYSKTDQMSKSATSKVSNSFITSVTSITSLDTGYQGDGEMSRPASRGGDHSPSNIPRVHPMRPILGREPSFMNNNQNNIAIIRRQDPMTDSDFFTESDADDIVNRGDRRAQVIDGQLYAPMVQGANVYVNQQPSTEDSCMESSGIFTDIENRADDETIHRINEHDSDMSPDGSTDTIKSSNTEYNNKKNSTVIQAHTDTFSNHQGHHSMSDSTTSTINSNCEKGGDRQSVISDDSINSVHSIQSRGVSSGDKLQSSFKKTTPNRKQNKNEANVALKKHEMSKRVIVGGDKLRHSSTSGTIVVDIENQENKRPVSTSGSGSGSSRKVTPNKWDAVMNKIASNKTNVKSKNYNEVKSKVTCGLTKKDSPGLQKSPTTEDDLFVTTTKRNFQLSSKRGRTHSQQSSQSDISENVGSPQTCSKSSSSSPRSAKKRDVRAISISPNDQSNAKSNGKCGNIKPVSLQKRFSNGVSPTASPSPTEQKSSPPPKKFLSKRSSQSSQSTSIKTPLKDHNRVVGTVTTTTTSLQTTPRTIATSPRGTVSPKTTQRILPSHTSSHSIQNTTHHGNGIVQTDGILNNKAHTNANQIDRIVNNGKLENCLNGIGSTRSVITATKATSTIEIDDVNLKNLNHANKGVEALGVLVQHLVFNLDALSAPILKKSNENATKNLLETKLQLDHARIICAKLEDQLVAKDQYFSERLKDIEDQHKNEISKVEIRLKELDQTTRDRITLLESQLVSKESEFEEKLQDVTKEMKSKLGEKDDELTLVKDKELELLKRIRALSSTENELREKVLASETEFGERLQLAAIRERELTDKLNLLNKELIEKERIFTEKINIAQNEILVLRSSRDSIGSDNIAPKVANCRPATLEDEIQSWRSVLEMKQKDISDLQKRNHDLENAAGALPGALAKISGLESRLEDLEIQLKMKNDEEKELLLKNKTLEQSYKYEMKNRTRLSLDNEQLKYRLKTNSERFSSALTELSKTYQDHSEELDETKNALYRIDNSTQSESSFASNGLDSCCGDDVSPPTSPVIKGVIEKNASVSYVLEINDDESPEALASRMIRRAGSFRQSLNERTPANSKRVNQQGANALTQSASAASILRYHSEQPTHSPKHESLRIRSKSVSVKSNGASNIVEIPEGKQSQHQTDNAPSMWNEPLYSSSPNSKRSRNPSVNSKEKDLLSEESETECSSVLKCRPNANNEQYSNFRRSNSYKHTKRGLITCNTAALTSQRPELCLSLPVHPTVKELKKCQQIKESAGEAMVSGTNSEDEASTASSDGSLSSRSSSSGRRRSSIEDAMIDKIVASLGDGRGGDGTPMELGGTPMEVSWSEDVDHFASDSAV